jgi:hypothetical protein
MANYVIADPVIGAPSPVSQVDTVQRWPLGYVARGVDNASGSAQLGGGMFVYLQGSNIASAGQIAHINGGTAILALTATAAPVGVAQGALSATNLYGWCQIQGVCDNVRGTNASIAANARLFISNAAGVVQSGAVAGAGINCMVPLASYTSADVYMKANLQFPFNIGSTASI